MARKAKVKVKVKSNRGAAKRFIATKNGFKHAQSHKRHILTKKSSKRKAQLRPASMVKQCDVRAVRRMLAGT